MNTRIPYHAGLKVNGQIISAVLTASGPLHAIERLEMQLAEQGVDGRVLWLIPVPDYRGQLDGTPT
jgi:hypothetical protein